MGGTCVSCFQLQLFSYLANWQWAVLSEDLNHQMNDNIRVKLQ